MVARERLNRPPFFPAIINVCSPLRSPIAPPEIRYAASWPTIVYTSAGAETNIALYVPLSSAERFIAGDADM